LKLVRTSAIENMIGEKAFQGSHQWELKRCRWRCDWSVEGDLGAIGVVRCLVLAYGFDLKVGCFGGIGFKFEIPMVKLLRAHGGCLGIERRRKAWKSAKSLGEPTNR
jgi:hypothetical protein